MAEGPSHPLIAHVRNRAEVEAAISIARERGGEGKSLSGHELVDRQ